MNGAADPGDNLGGNGMGNDLGGGGGGGADELVEALSDAEGSGIITEERKPLNRSTIVTFVVLVIGVGGVWYMYQRTGGPKSAGAKTKESVEAKKTIDNFLNGGEQNIKVMETMLRNTQKVVDQFLNYPSMTQIPLSDLKTNPFRVNPQTPGDGSAGELAEKKRREEERLAALRAVGNLQLQSIMYGDSRRACMINGALYTETQVVEEFTVEKINQASVVVKKGSYRFELRLQR
jgi:hypothetical protein